MEFNGIINSPMRYNNAGVPFYVVLDVETTGLIEHDGRPTKKILSEHPTSFPRIVQIAWILMSDSYEVIRERSYYIKQTAPIPVDSIQIHGITDEICEREGCDLKDVLIELADDIKYVSAIVGHNVTFDKQVIEAEFLRCNLPKPFTNMKKFDTMILGQEIMGRYRFPLKDLRDKLLGSGTSEYLGYQLHDAKYDAQITAKLFAWLHDNDYKGMRGRSFKKERSYEGNNSDEDTSGYCGCTTIILTIMIVVMIWLFGC